MDELASRNSAEATVGVGESVQLSGGNQPAGRGFMGGVMDSILNFKRKSVTPDSQPANSSEVSDSFMLFEPFLEDIYRQKYTHIIKQILILDSIN